MPDVVNPQTADAVNLTDVKNVGEMHALTAGFSTQTQQEHNSLINGNALANQKTIDAIIAGSLQVHSATMNALGARAAGFLLDQSNLQSEIANLGADVASVQQDIKAGQTTPPQTGTGGAFGSDAGSALLQQIVNAQAITNAQLAELIGALKKP